jgi:sugar phosphate isomerase/epimerase
MFMKTGITRRHFVQTTGLALAACGVLPAFGASRPASWPVGCRDVHLKFTGTNDPWQAMKMLGAECIEVQVTPEMTCPGISGAKPYSLATPEGIRALKADLRVNKCAISALMMANHLDERLEEELVWTKKTVQAAKALGVGTIRIDVVPRKLQDSEFLPFAIRACKQMCDLAAGTRVRFGIENHGKITNDPAFLRELFKGVGSKQLGLTLDIANFYWWGHPEQDLYGIYEEFASRAFHTHMKSIRYPAEKRNVKREMGWEYGKHAAPIHEGDINIERVIAILRKAGYKGDLCVEDESLGKVPKDRQAQVLKAELDYLKKLTRG